MARKEPEVTLERFNSHSVSARQGNGSEVDKEEVFGYFRTTWQSKPVVVTMEASRYKYAGWNDAGVIREATWSEWRVFANDAHYVAVGEASRRAPATPTRYVRAFLVKYAEELAPEAVARFERACDAYDTFAAIINGAE